MAYVIQCEAHAELSSSLGLREEPLSRHGEETNTLWDFLIGAEPSLISRGRCANNLQCSSLCPRVVQQCDSDGAPGTISGYTGIHVVPSHPPEEGGCVHSLGILSLCLFVPFSVSSFPF